MRLVVFVAACTAITDFNQFSAGDLATPYVPATFAQPCDPTEAMPCVPGQSAPTRPLACYPSLDGHPVAGNICTRECVMGPNACSDYGPNAVCGQVGTLAQANYCTTICNLPGMPCRAGLVCCGPLGAPIDSGMGACLPSCR